MRSLGRAILSSHRSFIVAWKQQILWPSDSVAFTYFLMALRSPNFDRDTSSSSYFWESTRFIDSSAGSLGDPQQDRLEPLFFIGNEERQMFQIQHNIQYNLSLSHTDTQAYFWLPLQFSVLGRDLKNGSAKTFHLSWRASKGMWIRSLTRMH